MWTGFGGTGSFGYTTQDVSQLGGTLNNRVRSVWNRTGSNVAISGGPSYTDLCSTIGPERSATSLVPLSTRSHRSTSTRPADICRRRTLDDLIAT
jgi:hypothetical protein